MYSSLQQTIFICRKKLKQSIRFTTMLQQTIWRLHQSINSALLYNDVTTCKSTNSTLYRDGTSLSGLLVFWETVLDGKSTNSWLEREIKIHYCLILSQCAFSFSIPMVSQGSTMPTSLFALSSPDSPTENFHLSGTSNFWK